jgi:TRAP-type uncharacterized transport system fused permease subunit
VMGDAEERILIFVFSAIGLFCIIAAWEGVVMDVINRANRLVLGIVGTLLLWPFDGVLLKIVLSVIFLVYLLFSFIQFNKKPTCAQLV